MKFLSELIYLFLPSKKGHVKTETTLVIRYRRISARYTCLLIAGIGIFFVISELRGAQIFITCILVGIPVVILMLVSDLTVTADRTKKTLTLQYRSVLLRRTKVIPFSDILQIAVQSNSGTSDEATTYMLAVDTVNKSIPFRSLYSSDDSSMYFDAVELEKFIGIGKNITG
jgi:hypothetical protein